MSSPEPQTTENPISDISPDDWYYKPALWAYENGVTSNTTFNPNNLCTNAEVITILWRANGEPAAAVYNSTMSLANPGQYYTRAVAWADNGGMFVGKDSSFDPTAPCSRADLMVYLYWATEQWTFSEEDKTVQTEYEQIINDAQLYEVHGSGLVYADYIDVDEDSKVELLTLGISGNDVTATVYANVDGHVGKACEETSLGIGPDFSICKANGHLYLSVSGWFSERAGEYRYCDYRSYKIDKEAFILEYDLSNTEEYIFEKDAIEYTYESSGIEITEREFNTILQMFTDEKSLFSLDYYSYEMSVYIQNRGFLPLPETKDNGPVVQPPPSGSNTLPADGNRIVFTGTVNRYTYDEVLSLQGETDPNPYDDHSYESFLLIVLDMPQTMELGSVGGGTRSGTVSLISVYNSNEPWLPPELEQYKGQHLIFSIDPSRTWWPSSTNLPLGEPSTDDVHVLGQASG